MPISELVDRACLEEGVLAFAARSGIATRLVQWYRKGERLPSTRTYERLRKALRMNRADMYAALKLQRELSGRAANSNRRNA